MYHEVIALQMAACAVRFKSFLSYFVEFLSASKRGGLWGLGNWEHGSLAKAGTIDVFEREGRDSSWKSRFWERRSTAITSLRSMLQFGIIVCSTQQGDAWVWASYWKQIDYSGSALSRQVWWHGGSWLQAPHAGIVPTIKCSLFSLFRFETQFSYY